MLKETLKKWAPTKEKLENYKVLGIFGRVIQANYLWGFNRNSVARAFSVGLFCAWIPVPFQMALAILGAILFRGNLPLAVGLVWITNPVTMPFLFTFAYVVGSKLMLIQHEPIKFSLSTEWFTHFFQNNWQPFLLGCFVIGTAMSIVGNIVIRLLWRYFTLKTLETRRLRKQQK